MYITCHRDLPDGTKACLAALLTVAGKKDEVVKLTSSIATMLGHTPAPCAGRLHRFRGRNVG